MGCDTACQGWFGRPAASKLWTGPWTQCGPLPDWVSAWPNTSVFVLGKRMEANSILQKDAIMAD